MHEDTVPDDFSLMMLVLHPGFSDLLDFTEVCGGIPILGSKTNAGWR
jgi:hypothetical protein